MTVKELIEQLQNQDQNKQIMIWDDEYVNAYPVKEIKEYFDNDVIITF